MRCLMSVRTKRVGRCRCSTRELHPSPIQGLPTKTQEWWTVCNPMQAPLEHRKPGEWWASMEEVFHTE